MSNKEEKHTLNNPLWNGPCNRYRQSKTGFYVCVRLRDGWGGDPFMVKRIAATGIKDAYKALTDAIDKYGPTHKVVIEPAEFGIYTDDSPLLKEGEEA